MKSYKRIIGTLLVSLFVISVSAQTSAGKFLIGGSSALNFSTTTYKYKSDDGSGTDSHEISVNFAPQFGYFVIDGLAVGLEIQAGFTSAKPDGGSSDDTETLTTIVGAPFARYYFGASKIKPYGQAAVGIGMASDKYFDYFEDAKVTDHYGIFAYQFKAGVGMFFNDYVSLDLGFSYQYQSSKAKEDNDANYRDIGSIIAFEAGIVIVL
jgi:outer membrane protein